MNVLPGVSRESDGGHNVTDFGLSIKLKRQRSVPVGNGASRKSDILTKWVTLFQMCRERKVQTADAFRYFRKLASVIDFIRG